MKMKNVLSCNSSALRIKYITLKGRGSVEESVVLNFLQALKDRDLGHKNVI